VDTGRQSIGQRLELSAHVQRVVHRGAKVPGNERVGHAPELIARLPARCGVPQAVLEIRLTANVDRVGSGWNDEGVLDIAEQLRHELPPEGGRGGLVSIAAGALQSSQNPVVQTPLAADRLSIRLQAPREEASAAIGVGGAS
jgi:hypothetical protein